MRRWWLGLLTLAVAHAAEVTPIQLGQGVWRAEAAVTQHPLPGGGTKAMQADLYGLVLEQPAEVRVTFFAEAPLGVVIKALDQPDDKGNPRTLGLVAAGKPWRQSLAAGRFMFIVAGDPPMDGAYLLSVASPKEPDDTFERVADAAPGDYPFLGAFDLGRPISGLEVSPEGARLLAWSADEAWLYELESRQAFRLPKLDGPLRRAEFSPDGWTALVVSAGGALVLGLPDLTGTAKFTAAEPVLDAVYVGRQQRVAVLPEGKPVYIASPIEGDLAYLPGTTGGTALVGDSLAGGLAVRYGEQRVAVFDPMERRQYGAGSWPAAPTHLQLQPGAPILLGTGPSATMTWKAGPEPEATTLPDATDGDINPLGAIALGGASGVRLIREESVTELTAEPVDLVRFSPTGHRLAAATAAGRVMVWNTEAMLAREPEGGGLTEASRLYRDGLERFKAQDWSLAHLRFEASLAKLRELPQEGEVLEYTCLALLRMSQTSYMTRAYEQALAEAEDLLTAVDVLPGGPFQAQNRAFGWYRKGESLWALDRRDDAKAAYRQALEAGLEGAAAENARGKLAE